MYVKLYDGTPIIANMPDEEAIKQGYKDAVFAEKPVTEDGFVAVSSWEETENSVIQSWSIVEKQEDDPDNYVKAKAYDILMGASE